MFAGSLAIAGPAHDAAQEHVRRSQSARASGQLDVALTELLAAQALERTPQRLFEIGMLFHQRNECLLAVEFLRQYLRALPDPVESAAATTAIVKCGGNPRPGASLFPPDLIGPDTVGTPGRSLLSVYGLMEPGTVPRRTSAADAVPIGEPPLPAPATATAPVDVDAPVSRPRPWYADPMGTGLVAGGFALGVIGAVTYREAHSTLDDAERADTIREYADLVERAHTQRTYAGLLLAGSTGLIAVGVTRLWYVRERNANLTLVPARGGGVVTWHRRF
jgi:hypothetical protein